MMKSTCTTACLIVGASMALGLNGCNDRSAVPEAADTADEAQVEEHTDTREMDYRELSREELREQLDQTMARLNEQLDALQDRTGEEAESLRETLVQHQQELRIFMDDMADASGERWESMKVNIAEQLEQTAAWLRESAPDDS